ncbi:unnamed protein product [Medioppia subpectinata]|uniref:CRAL-TRIO domain-containing protein n=1 Tax=Medioppia subpectinata TaxID=1979941 RepID=A0A7R9KVA0_9ACAR|nr:unnamed protein product [Medioppia subpectinata]CAG2110113.1 unnamed protein product [Medioppia subpectinata]
MNQVEELRSKVLLYAKEHPDAIHPIDIERVKTKNWFLERYLKEYKNDEKMAETALLYSLNVFKTEGLHEMNDTYFPAEFYAMGNFIGFGRSKKDLAVMGVIGRCAPNVSDMSEEMFELALKFFKYIFMKYYLEVDGEPAVVYGILSKMGMHNVDMEFDKQVVAFVNAHAPDSKVTFLLIDLGWIVKFAINLLINLLNENLRNKIRFADWSHVEEWVALDQMPKYVGGTNEGFRRIPDGVKSGKCLPHLQHIPEEEWDAVIQQNGECILEGLKESGLNSLPDRNT